MWLRIALVTRNLFLGFRNAPQLTGLICVKNLFLFLIKCFHLIPLRTSSWLCGWDDCFQEDLFFRLHEQHQVCIVVDDHDRDLLAHSQQIRYLRQASPSEKVLECQSDHLADHLGSARAVSYIARS